MSRSDFRHGVNENHSVILNILCRQRSGLNIVHFNARSLNGLKFDHVRSSFENSQVDVICVTETWFNDEVSVRHHMIDGYNLFQNNRKDKKGGGVAIYCNTNLKAKFINKSKDSNVEFINVEISDTMTKILVSCVYNPNKKYSLEPFFADLNNCLIEYDHYITCGDFNVNLLTEDKFSEELVDFVSSAGLTIVNNQMPTRFDPTFSPSLLDLILISDSSLLLLFDQISFVSDHDLLFCTLNIHLNRNETSRIITFRDYNSIDFPSLFSELCASNLTDCWYESTVDRKLDVFLSTLQDIYNRHVPMRSFNVKNCSCPWYTAAVRQSIRERNRCYDTWKKYQSPINRVAYTRARNHATLVIRQSKKTYFARKLNTSLPSGQLWKNIKNLGVHSRVSMDCCLDPDELNDIFCANATLNSLNNNCHLTTHYSSHTFQFTTVSEIDVHKAVMNIRSNAVGEDGVSIKFLKMILPYVIGSLTHIYNHCITTSNFPKLWKIGRIIPVAKVSSPTCPNDYRPISILSVLSKIFESLMSTQITEYLDTNALLSPLQSGFRIGHSCTSAALKIIDDIRPEYDIGNLSLMCLLDFSKAFDKVNHSILCRKLKHYFGFDDTALTLMKNYLSGRAKSYCWRQRVLSQGHYIWRSRICSGTVVV